MRHKVPLTPNCPRYGSGSVGAGASRPDVGERLSGSRRSSSVGAGPSRRDVGEQLSGSRREENSERKRERERGLLSQSAVCLTVYRQLRAASPRRPSPSVPGAAGCRRRAVPARTGRQSHLHNELGSGPVGRNTGRWPAADRRAEVKQRQSQVTRRVRHQTGTPPEHTFVWSSSSLVFMRQTQQDMCLDDSSSRDCALCKSYVKRKPESHVVIILITNNATSVPWKFG